MGPSTSFVGNLAIIFHPPLISATSSILGRALVLLMLRSPPTKRASPLSSISRISCLASSITLSGLLSDANRSVISCQAGAVRLACNTSFVRERKYTSIIQLEPRALLKMCFFPPFSKIQRRL
jgi:hypothetical protein